MHQRLLPSDTAIFLCDIQDCFRKSISGFDDVLGTCHFLLSCARIMNVPCVITEQYPEKLKHTVAELQPLLQESETQKAYAVFPKVDFTMWIDEVKKYVKENLPNVKNIILCGMETHICVFQSCMDLLNEEYNVFVCVDGVSSRSLVDRKVGLNGMEKMGATLITSENIVYQMLLSKNSEFFKPISALVKSKKLPELLGM